MKRISFVLALALGWGPTASAMMLPVQGDGGALHGYQIPSWVPLSGLVFIFDAAQKVTLAGSNVTAQADMSGNGNNMVAMSTPPTFTASSIDGNPAITTTGAASQGLHNTSVLLTSNNSARTYIAVVKAASASAQISFDWRGGSSDFYQAMGIGGTFYVYGNANVNISAFGTSRSGLATEQEWLSDGVNVGTNQQGVALSMGTTAVTGGDNGIAGFSSGARYDGTSGFIGDKCVELGWNRQLTAGELNGIREGLQARFPSLGTIAAPILVSADSLNVAPLGTKTITATGGSGTFSFSLATNGSGGSINSGTGVYTAGNTGGVVDVITATDTAGFSASVNVLVTTAAPAIHVTSGKRVLFLGDSTASAANGTAWWNTEFTTSVNAALSPGSITSIDGGHVGAQATDILTNFSSWVTPNTPDVTFLTCGINDVTTGAETVAAYAANMASIIAQLLAGTTTKVAVTGITCLGEVWSTGPVWGVNSNDAQIDQFNTALESVVNGLRNPNVIFINFRKQLLPWEVTNNPTKTSTGHATIDGKHPNATGIVVESGFAFAQVVAP